MSAELNERRAFAFGLSFNAARRASAAVAEATSPFEPVSGTRYFLSPDRDSGYAVRADGELVYVFSLVPGRGDFIVSDAIRNGASRLDCFDGYLTRLYARNGFVETRREANWSPGSPDVVYMERA